MKRLGLSFEAMISRVCSSRMLKDKLGENKRNVIFSPSQLFGNGSVKRRIEAALMCLSRPSIAGSISGIFFSFLRFELVEDCDARERPEIVS